MEKTKPQQMSKKARSLLVHVATSRMTDLRPDVIKKNATRARSLAAQIISGTYKY